MAKCQEQYQPAENFELKRAFSEARERQSPEEPASSRSIGQELPARAQHFSISGMPELNVPLCQAPHTQATQQHPQKYHVAEMVELYSSLFQKRVS